MKARFITLLPLLGACHAINAESFPPVIDNSMYPVGAESAAKPAAPNVLYEMMGRLEQLQAEVQQLTGKVEEQANLIAELKNSQTTLYSDFDERMQALEKKTDGAKADAANANPAQENTAEAQVQVQDVSGEAPVVAESAAATAANPEVKPAPAPEAVPASANAPVGDEKQQYQQAYEALRNGHTSQAIAQFNTLLSQNANSEYAHNAQYWLGEAYRVNQDVDLARKAFISVVEHYPDSLKVPDALLKLGYIEDEQKNTAKAREYLTRVTKEFPSSTASQRAAKKLLLLDDVKQ